MADTWHTPRDWIAGEVVTEVMMDEHIGDNMTYLKERLLAFCVTNVGCFTFESKTSGTVGIS